MAEIVNNQIYIDGQPLFYARPYEIKLQRGVQPWFFSVILTPDQVPHFEAKVNNKVTIKIVTPDDVPTREAIVELKGWYVIAVQPATDGLFQMTVADPRWGMNNNKVTALYNCRTTGGYRKASLKNGARRWRCFEAIKDVVEKQLKGKLYLGDLPARLKDVVLPDDLGNFYGAWFGAPMALVLTPMLEAIRCDLVPLDDGSLALVARGEKTPGETSRWVETLRRWAVGGVYGKRDIHFQVPATIKYLLPVRREKRFEYEEADSRSTSSNRASDPILENVAPDYKPDEPNDAQPEFITFLRFVVDKLKLSVGQFRRRYLGPKIVDTDNMTLEEEDRALTYEGIARGAYRTIFRIQDTGLGRDARQIYADIQFGRLQDNGTNKEAPVYADHTNVYRYGWLENKRDPIYMAKFSKSFKLDGHRPAPYRVRWLPARDELIFELVLDNKYDKIKHVHLGLFEEEMRFGDPAAILSGTRPLGFESNGELAERFNLWIYWHGWVLTDKYEHVESVSGKTNDLQMTVPVYDLGAYYNYDGELINRSAITERLKDLHKKMEESFKQRNAGVIECAGIAPIQEQIYTRGEIFETSILVGAEREYVIKTRYTVQPEVRPPSNTVSEFVSVEENI